MQHVHWALDGFFLRSDKACSFKLSIKQNWTICLSNLSWEKSGLALEVPRNWSNKLCLFFVLYFAYFASNLPAEGHDRCEKTKMERRVAETFIWCQSSLSSDEIALQRKWKKCSLLMIGVSRVRLEGLFKRLLARIGNGNQDQERQWAEHWPRTSGGVHTLFSRVAARTHAWTQELDHDSLPKTRRVGPSYWHFRHQTIRDQ